MIVLIEIIVLIFICLILITCFDSFQCTINMSDDVSPTGVMEFDTHHTDPSLTACGEALALAYTRIPNKIPAEFMK